MFIDLVLDLGLAMTCDSVKIYVASGLIVSLTFQALFSSLT